MYIKILFKLKSVVYELPLPEKPDIVLGIECIESKSVESNSINLIVDMIDFLPNVQTTSEKNTNEKKDNFFWKVGKFLDKTTSDIGNKINNLGITKSAKNIAEKASGTIKEKSKEAYVKI